MSTTTGTSPTQQNQHPHAAVPEPRGSAGAGSSELDSGQGKTVIADVVVSKIAATAARDVPGVHGFGGGAARAFGAVRERIPGARATSSRGVTVEVGERQAAVDLVIVVEYGVSIVELTRAVRRHVVGAVEQMTGLQVVEVNINVTDLHQPGDADGETDDTSSAKPARVA